jgi:hypothetical protein
MRLGRLTSLLPIVALVPRLGLIVLASDRQTVSPETRTTLLWISAAALAVLAGVAELYVGMAVVSRRHGGLAALWVVLTVLLNALVVPLSVSGLEAVPVWEILNSRLLQVAWGSGLGLLSTLCVCGCLWADTVRERSGLPAAYEAHLQARLADEETRRAALEGELASLRQAQERSSSAEASAPAAQAKHSACGFCGYWDADQRKVAGHIRHCGRRRAVAAAPGSAGVPAEQEVAADAEAELARSSETGEVFDVARD